jgi:hypothetical protein
MSEKADTVLTLGQWAKNVRTRRAPRWLIHNLLPADNLVLVSGVPKNAQKTFLAMTAALVVATGKDAPHMKSGGAKKVLYIYEEGDQPGTLARFDALAEGHDFGAIDEIDNLFLAHRTGFMLDNEDSVDRISEFVARHDIALIIIDTLAKCMQGDENSVQAVGNALRRCNSLRNSECTIMFVHHTRKENVKLSNGSYGTPEPDADIRGSSALCGAYETHWAVRLYNSGLSDEQEKFLFVGGKEIPWRAYDYKYNFINEEVQGELGIEQHMRKCELVLSQRPDLPYIEAKKTKKKAETA